MGRASLQLDLGTNWRQFALLVIVNGFVGAMFGLERSLIPLIAEHEFGLVSRSAILSFFTVKVPGSPGSAVLRLP